MLAQHVLQQNTLSEDEEHAIRWMIRNDSKLGHRQPRDCDYCNHPERRGVRVVTKAERRKNIHQTKRLYGCIGKAIQPCKVVNEKSVYELKTCPHKVFREGGIIHYFRAYSWFDQKGIFPFGDFEDQSEKLVRVFETIRTEHRRIDKELADKEQKK